MHQLVLQRARHREQEHQHDLQPEGHHPRVRQTGHRFQTVRLPELLRPPGSQAIILPHNQDPAQTEHLVIAEVVAVVALVEVVALVAVGQEEAVGEGDSFEWSTVDGPRSGVVSQRVAACC